MKLTPRGQGYRFTKKSWEPNRYWDIKSVGKGQFREVRAVNERGDLVVIVNREDEADWICLGTTAKLKREDRRKS